MDSIHRHSNRLCIQAMGEGSKRARWGACAKPKPPTHQLISCLNQLPALWLTDLCAVVLVTWEKCVCLRLSGFDWSNSWGRQLGSVWIRDHGSRRQSRWIADFLWSRPGSLPQISHFPPHHSFPSCHYFINQMVTNRTSLTTRILRYEAGRHNLRSFLAANSTQNYFLIARMLSFLWHSRQKCRI